MNIAETLDELKRKAGKDAELKRRILQTRTEANPLSAFCNLCRKLGYPVYRDGPGLCRRKLLRGNQAKHQWRRGEFAALKGQKMILLKCFLQSWNGNYDDGICCLKNNMFILKQVRRAKPERTAFLCKNSHLTNNIICYIVYPSAILYSV